LAQAVLQLALAGGFCCGVAGAQIPGSVGLPGAISVPKQIPDRPSVRSSLPPEFAIPVERLGFSAPGPIYLGQRYRFASLDFLDENRLLFTFRVPGLIRREFGDSGDSDEHKIRAVVLSLPEGTVQAEALWTLHDRLRYLWMLKDGHFLLRDGRGLQLGNSGLDLKPFLSFPGPLLSLEMDPAQQFLVTNSREPIPADANAGGSQGPATSSSAGGPDDPAKAGKAEIAVRVLRRDSGKVMLVSRVRTPVHLPINAEGYLESLRSRGSEWLVNLNYFTGGSTEVGRVESSCTPDFEFVSQREVLGSVCNDMGSAGLVALTAGGRRLWRVPDPPRQIWPMQVMGSNGTRFVRETLFVAHSIDAYSPLDQEDVKGQVVTVQDSADGKVELLAEASPVLDAGGNVAISPSGRRVAVLDAGAIQIYTLPEPPPLQDGETKAGR